MKLLLLLLEVLLLLASFGRFFPQLLLPLLLLLLLLLLILPLPLPLEDDARIFICKDEDYTRT